ncbi:MAG: hypothetical protein KI792_00635 [Alphaproteobacteria bacterium]|nr:hypothetical protein [Alphaproteobacteria bacterium SS10]
MSAPNKVLPLQLNDENPADMADQARLDAAEAGWQTTLEALNLVLTAAGQVGHPDQVALDTVALAKSRIDSALAMMERVQDVSDQLEFSATSTAQH